MSWSGRVSELDLCRQDAVERFFADVRPDYVFLAAARVGGILANVIRTGRTCIRDNLFIQTNVIDAAHRFGTKKLLFLGSSCISSEAQSPQPMKEEYLPTGLARTDEPALRCRQDCRYRRWCVPTGGSARSTGISVLPTNGYGPQDNFDLDSSHVLPAASFGISRGKASGARLR